MTNVVHVLNQFSTGAGGEDKANIAIGAVESSAGYCSI